MRCTDIIKDQFHIDERIVNISEKVDSDICFLFKTVDKIRSYNQLKVINAMQRCGLSETHFCGSSGYGYGDRGREVLDSVYANIFSSESALVRHQIIAGTHAISLAMFGNLRPGDELLSITGKPYETLEEVIGLRGYGAGSLLDFGITFSQTELNLYNDFDYESIKNSINLKTRMIFIQRSRGYSWRKPVSCESIRKVISYIRELSKDIIILVDNCYGEFVETVEPIESGADIVAGSLIKNPGGGIAQAGGYIAGARRYVINAACRLTSPGLADKVGPSLGQNRHMFQGLFMSPHIVSESLKGAIFCASIMNRFGFEVSPQPEDERHDIIQAIKFGAPEPLVAFCQGIQKGSPVDSFVVPQPWSMPGYDSDVIMASGSFVQGSSIELSIDAPLKPPYIAYLQGGMVYEGIRIGIMTALQSMLDKGLVKI